MQATNPCPCIRHSADGGAAGLRLILKRWAATRIVAVPVQLTTVAGRYVNGAPHSIACRLFSIVSLIGKESSRMARRGKKRTDDAGNAGSHTRDNFKAGVKALLAGRAGYRCSNPSCRRPTTGPNHDPDKITKLGQASHITAAAEGGPRYDPSLEPEARSGYENGVWLCYWCARWVDVDVHRFPVALLHEWRRQAEAQALAELTLGGRKVTATVAAPALGERWLQLADMAFADVNAVTAGGDFAYLRGRSFGDFVQYTDGGPNRTRVLEVSSAMLDAVEPKVVSLQETAVWEKSAFSVASDGFSAMLSEPVKRLPGDCLGFIGSLAIDILEMAGRDANAIECSLKRWDMGMSALVAAVTIRISSGSGRLPVLNQQTQSFTTYANGLLQGIGIPNDVIDLILPVKCRPLADLVSAIGKVAANTEAKFPELNLNQIDMWKQILVGTSSCPGPFTPWGAAAGGSEALDSIVLNLVNSHSPVLSK